MKRQRQGAYNREYYKQLVKADRYSLFPSDSTEYQSIPDIPEAQKLSTLSTLSSASQIGSDLMVDLFLENSLFMSIYLSTR